MHGRGRGEWAAIQRIFSSGENVGSFYARDFTTKKGYVDLVGFL